ncbi:hypothetical protein A0S52_004953, partial [Escherichia coli]|nr:hypothetical protein [Escherichia coli]
GSKRFVNSAPRLKQEVQSIRRWLKLRDEWVEEGYEWLFNLYGRSATGITVVLGGTGVVNIYDARDSHDGPVHQCMRRDIVRVFFRGSGIRMQKIPLLDWFYAINQDDNLLIFY